MATFKSGEVTFNGDGTASYVNGFNGINRGTLDFTKQQVQQGNYLINGTSSYSRNVDKFVLQPNESNSKLFGSFISSDGTRHIGTRNCNIDIKGSHYFVVRDNKVYGVAYNYGGAAFIYNIFNGNTENADNSSTIQNDTAATKSNDTIQNPSSATTNTATTATNTATTQNTQSATASTPQYKYVARKYNEISQVQQVLKDKGFYSDKIDGQVGPKTAAALLKYVQSKEGTNTVQNDATQNTQSNSTTTNPAQLQEVKEFYNLLDRMKDVF